MLYRPKYCCNCGEKIERAEWSLWSSRRFCELCETEFKGADYLPRALVAAGLILSLFGFSSLLSRSQNSNGPAGVAPKAALKPAAPAKQVQATTAEMPSVTPRISVPENTANNAQKTTEQPAGTASSSDAPAYYCGALTKKGTPCSRKVKAKGTRCWQHADK